MKTILIAAILSFSAGAGAATVTLKTRAPAPTPIVQVEPAQSEPLNLVASPQHDTSSCFEIVGGEYHCQ